MVDYYYEFFTLTQYRIIKRDGVSLQTIQDNDENFLIWVETNIPEKTIIDSEEVYLTITDGTVVLDKYKAIVKMQKDTEVYIDTYMPQWRLNRWRRYYDLYQKVNNSQTLNTIEQSEYDSFPDSNETHIICQSYVPLALQWCIDCITAHKTALLNVAAATTLEELNAATIVNYPSWIV